MADSAVDQNRLYATTDAQVWAEEFVKVCPDVDQGLMIGWFANAIETAKTIERQKWALTRTSGARVVDEAKQTLEHLEDAVTHINAAILLLHTDDGSRLGEAKAIIRSVMFDLDNQMVERSGLVDGEGRS